MNNKKTILLYGFLLVNSIHWGGFVLTALLNNVIGIFIQFDDLPWFRIVILIIEIFVVIRLLNYQSNEITAKSLLMLMTFTIVLFIGTQFDSYYDYSPSFCGNSLIDGSLDSLYNKRNQNLNYVHIIETLLLSTGIVIYILGHVKKDVK
tara:strand:+ start:237 stop:683 length:447 start_codon:yes stop_codon:yes gene_type:complete